MFSYAKQIHSSYKSKLQKIKLFYIKSHKSEQFREKKESEKIHVERERKKLTGAILDVRRQVDFFLLFSEWDIGEENQFKVVNFNDLRKW